MDQVVKELCANQPAEGLSSKQAGREGDMM